MLAFWYKATQWFTNLVRKNVTAALIALLFAGIVAGGYGMKYLFLRSEEKDDKIVEELRAELEKVKKESREDALVYREEIRQLNRDKLDLARELSIDLKDQRSKVETIEEEKRKAAQEIAKMSLSNRKQLQTLSNEFKKISESDVQN